MNLFNCFIIIIIIFVSPGSKGSRRLKTNKLKRKCCSD